MEPSGLCKIFQIVDRESAVHAVRCLLQYVRDLLKIVSFLLQLACIDRQDSLGERCIERIHKTYPPVRVFLSEGICCDSCSVVSSRNIAAE